MAKYLMFLCVVIFVVYQTQSASIDKTMSNPDECVDNHPDNGCVEWAKNGDCTSGPYKAEMEKYCRKSCGLCTKRAVKREHRFYSDEEPLSRREPIPTCQDTGPGEKCRKWAKDGSCIPGNTWYSYMMKYCLASCNPDCNKDAKLERRGFMPRLFTRETAKLLVNGVEDACLKAHNDYRAAHSTPPLSWDSGLAKDSQEYARELADFDKWEHSKSGGKYGENLYYIYTYGKPMTDAENLCRMAVKAWYDEIKDYDYSNPKFSGATGHFTQVIWKNTQSVGMGLAQIKRSGRTYVYAVARYTPPGNYYGQFEENVLPVNTQV